MLRGQAKPGSWAEFAEADQRLNPVYTGSNVWRIWFHVISGGMDFEDVRAATAEEAAAQLRCFAASCSARADNAELVRAA